MLVAKVCELKHNQAAWVSRLDKSLTRRSRFGHSAPETKEGGVEFTLPFRPFAALCAAMAPPRLKVAPPQSFSGYATGGGAAIILTYISA